MVHVSSLFIAIILITCKVDRLLATEDDGQPDVPVANSIKATPDKLGNLHVHVHGDLNKSVTIHLKDVQPKIIQIHLHTGSDSSDDSKKIDTAQNTTTSSEPQIPNDDIPQNDDTSPDPLSSQDNPPDIPSNQLPQIPEDDMPSDQQMVSQDNPYHTEDIDDMQQQQQQQQDIASAEAMDGGSSNQDAVVSAEQSSNTNPINSDAIPSDQPQSGDNFDCMKELAKLRESHQKLVSDKEMLRQQIEEYKKRLLPMIEEVDNYASDASK